MPAGDYHESLWEGVPEGLTPEHFERRRAFLLSHVSDGQRVLDVGSGEGEFAAALAAAGADVLAVDVAEEPLRRARRRHPALELALLPVDGSWPLADAAFDVVWAGEVIEHVADTAAWLSEVRRVLRSGGLLLLTTPDNGSLRMMRLALRPRALDAWLDPRGDHLRFYTRRTLAGLLGDFGFDDVVVRARGGVLLARARRGRY